MFNNDIALAGTSVTDTFSLQSVVGGKSIRSDATATPGINRYLTISHQSVSRAWGAADRHLIRLDRAFSPAEEGDAVVQASVQLVIEVPRKDVSAAQIQNLVDQMEAFTGTSGYVAKILNSEP
jgi:hypothetical protein